MAKFTALTLTLCAFINASLLPTYVLGSNDTTTVSSSDVDQSVVASSSGVDGVSDDNTNTNTTVTTTTTSAIDSNATTTTTSTTESYTTTAVTTTLGPNQIEIEASYTATEILPSNVTAGLLYSSSTYVGAKKHGLANSVSGLGEDEITITGFVVAEATTSGSGGSSRLLREFNDNKFSTMSDSESDALALQRVLQATTVTTTTTYNPSAQLSVKTQFKVAVANSNQGVIMMSSILTAANSGAIKNATDQAMAAADWSTDTVLSAAPSIVSGSFVVSEVPNMVTSDVITSGSWRVDYFSDPLCTTSSGHTPTQGHIGSCTQGSLNPQNSALAPTCGTALTIQDYQSTSTCDITSTGTTGILAASYSYKVGICEPDNASNGGSSDNGDYRMISCSTSALQVSTGGSVMGRRGNTNYSSLFMSGIVTMSLVFTSGLAIMKFQI